jgi:ATP-dependent DNA ligase
LVDRPPAGPGWLHEIKHDGFRILALKQGERVQVWSRRGADFTYRFPTIAKAVGSLNVDRALIDGEAVVLKADGRSDFGALMTKRGGAQARSWPSIFCASMATISASSRSRRGGRRSSS